MFTGLGPDCLLFPPVAFLAPLASRSHVLGAAVLGCAPPISLRASERPQGLALGCVSRGREQQGTCSPTGTQRCLGSQGSLGQHHLLLQVWRKERGSPRGWGGEERWPFSLSTLQCLALPPSFPAASGVPPPSLVVLLRGRGLVLTRSFLRVLFSGSSSALSAVGVARSRWGCLVLLCLVPWEGTKGKEPPWFWSSAGEQVLFPLEKLCAYK